MLKTPQTSRGKMNFPLKILLRSAKGATQVHMKYIERYLTKKKKIVNKIMKRKQIRKA
jgi:hypothetical protein